MPSLSLLTSLADLRGKADAWNDLWGRSELAVPTVQADCVAQWIEKFRPGAPFRAIVVSEEDRLLAALPLAGRPLASLVEVGAVTSNEWTIAGDLLLDPQCDIPAVLDELCKAMRGLPWSLLWLDEVPLATPRWRALLAALDRAGFGADVTERIDIGYIHIGEDWEATRQSWTRNHRQQMTKKKKKLATLGQVSLEVIDQWESDQVEPLLLRGFIVEDRNWKGREGTSVLKSKGMFPFFVEQAKTLAARGQLMLSFLQCDEQDVAFEYGYSAKGVYHSMKVGYDEQFSSYSPGKLLLGALLEKFHRDGSHRAVDLVGPLTPATACWKPQIYNVSRLVVAPKKVLGQALLHAYCHWWPYLKSLRGKQVEPAVPGAKPESKPVAVG